MFIYEHKITFKKKIKKSWTKCHLLIFSCCAKLGLKELLREKGWNVTAKDD